MQRTAAHKRLDWRAVLVTLAASTVVSVCDADITIDLTHIGNPGNPDDDPPGDFIGGGVDYEYYIGTYEITVNQYTEFLNAKAQSDPYGLYDDSMSTGGGAGGGFILRSGTEGSYSYTAVSGKEDQPVRWVSFFDSLRFCNWLANGQSDGDTETGSYTLSLGLSVVRESGATWVLPTEDEWYKAAYYSGSGSLYYDYPHGTDDVPAEPTNGTSPRVMNFGDDPFWQGTVCFTSVGDTTGQSPYGTRDQGGNVAEWLETQSVQPPSYYRVIRGGSFLDQAGALSVTERDGADPAMEGAGFGFRLVHLIPEPTTCLLVLLGTAVLALSHKR